MKKFFYVFFSLLTLGYFINVFAATVEGIVSDANTDKPILGVNIILSTNPVSSQSDVVNYTARTDSSGHYLIPDIKPGIYVVMAECKNYEAYIPEKILIPDSSNAVIEFNFKLIPSYYPPSRNGIISGKIFYEMGNLSPVLGAYISAFPANKEMFIEPWLGDFVAVSDSSGKYSLSVPEGKYKVLCYKFYNNSFYQEYYFNTSYPDKAIIIDVKADSEVTYVDFGIPQASTDTVVITVNGNVSDKDNNPVAKAYVHIELPDIYTFRYDPLMELEGYTDEKGNYTITFPLYKAFYAHNGIVYVKKDGYDVEFFNEKKNYYEADRLNFDSSFSFKNIDFTLDPVTPEQYYSISGKVVDDNGAPIRSALITGVDDVSIKYLYALTDSSGFYSISNVPIGKYYILFIAKGFAPEYYKNALKWEDAAIITADKNNFNIDASLTQINSLPPDTSFIIISGSIKSFNNTALPGVLVTVLNQGNNVVAYGLTNAAGEYYIEGLAKGNYIVQASLVNYSSKDENISFNTSNGMQIINFNMNPAAPTSVNDKISLIPEKLELYPNHPNPFNPSTVISFALPSQDFVTLKVYNIIGQEVATLINGMLNAGKHSITFDAKGLGTGVYFYQLKTGSSSIVKKMLLTK